MKKLTTVAKLVFAAGLVLALSGCAQKYVRTSTGSAGQTKFLYTQGSKSGVIKCDTNDATGALTNCRVMEVTIE